MMVKMNLHRIKPPLGIWSIRGACDMVILSVRDVWEMSRIAGIMGNQIIQYEGIYLATSSASALSNFILAITFVAASIISLRTITKILGTVLCVTSAAAMTLVKGPKLLNYAQLPSANSLLSNLTETDDRWLLGIFLVILGMCQSRPSSRAVAAETGVDTHPVYKLTPSPNLHLRSSSTTRHIP
ncbi:WAT1-related protein [Tanacetum coccineum]